MDTDYFDSPPSERQLRMEKQFATFRGIKFSTTDAELGVGRRTVLDEFPFRDGATSQDLGVRPRRFSVEGHLVGRDYLARRDALIAAFEERGPGELVHPRYGNVWVIVEGEAKFRESFREQGIARFSIVFIQTVDPQKPGGKKDTAAWIARTSDLVDDACRVAYAEDVEITGPEILRNNLLEGFLKDLESIGSIASRFVESTSSVAASIKSFGSRLRALISSPLDLALQLQGIYVDLTADMSMNLMMRGSHAFLMLNKANRAGISTLYGSPTNMSTMSKVTLNERTRAALHRRAAITAQARILAIAIGEEAVATAQEAASWRNKLTDQIDIELELGDPDANTVRALSQLRSAVVQDVAERAELLRQRSTFTSVAVLPAVVLAHRIYQDATRADELVARNGVAHPAFVPAGPLEILR